MWADRGDIAEVDLRSLMFSAAWIVSMFSNQKKQVIKAAKSSRLPPLGDMQLGSCRLCVTMVELLLETVPSCCEWDVAVEDGVEGRVECREAPE